MIQFGGDTPIAVLQGYDEVNITISPGGVIKFTDGTKEFKLYVQMDNILSSVIIACCSSVMLWDETIDAQAKHADDYMKSNCSDFAQWTWQVVVAKNSNDTYTVNLAGHESIHTMSELYDIWCDGGIR